jgi:hypothetical protein
LGKPRFPSFRIRNDTDGAPDGFASIVCFLDTAGNDLAVCLRHSRCLHNGTPCLGILSTDKSGPCLPPGCFIQHPRCHRFWPMLTLRHGTGDSSGNERPKQDAAEHSASDRLKHLAASWNVTLEATSSFLSANTSRQSILMALRRS